MSTTIKIKRGLKTNLPTLSEGELAYCTDTNELFIGTVSGNELVNQDLDTDEYIVSGNFDDNTGDLVLTRSDNQEITINLDGRYLQTFTDTNDFVTSANFTNGTLTLTRTDSGTVTVSLDGRYLQSFTETDPTVPAHVKDITQTNINNWDTAYGWGDHATENYLTSFTETDPVFLAQKGQANGVATLDANSKVPAAQLPSYVDDVLEYANLGSFPGTGETGKIYVTLDTNKTYRWTGSAYVEISASLVPNNGTLTLATSGVATGSQTFTADQSTNATFTVDVPGTNIAQGTRTTTTVPITSSTGNNATLEAATTSLAGVMNSADKTKLDGIAAGAQVNVGTNLGSSGTGGTRTITSSTGNNTSITYTAADVGAAATSHNHSAANITSGTLALARGGTNRSDGRSTGVIETRANTAISIWVGTQSQYNAIGTKDTNTLYFVTEV
jgi:hypothetical protein